MGLSSGRGASRRAGELGSFMPNILTKGCHTIAASPEHKAAGAAAKLSAAMHSLAKLQHKTPGDLGHFRNALASLHDQLGRANKGGATHEALDRISHGADELLHSLDEAHNQADHQGGPEQPTWQRGQRPNTPRADLSSLDRLGTVAHRGTPEQVQQDRQKIRMLAERAQNESLTETQRKAALLEARTMIKTYVEELHNAFGKTGVVHAEDPAKWWEHWREQNVILGGARAEDSALKALIDRIDVSSPKEKFFWSGAKEVAAELGKQQGKTILEQTGCRVLDEWDNAILASGWHQGVSAIFCGVSAEYAKEAKGDLQVYQSEANFARGGGDVWRNAELPTILALGQVTSITYHAVVTDKNSPDYGKELYSRTDKVVGDQLVPETSHPKYTPPTSATKTYPKTSKKRP